MPDKPLALIRQAISWAVLRYKLRVIGGGRGRRIHGRKLFELLCVVYRGWNTVCSLFLFVFGVCPFDLSIVSCESYYFVHHFA